MPRVDFSELAGRTFACVPGCGFCCATSPRLVEGEPARFGGDPALARLARRRSDGTVGIALARERGACAALAEDRTCSIYEARPTACRLYPFHVHLGPRVQVVLHEACPGVHDHPRRPAGAGDAQEAAQRVLSAALTPAALREAARAAANFREFDRRAQAMEAPASAAELEGAMSPHLPRLLDRDGLAVAAGNLEEGDLLLEDLRSLLDGPPGGDALPLLSHVVEESLAPDPEGRPAFVAWDLTWARVEAVRGVVRVAGAREAAWPVKDLLLAIDADARAILGRYLASLLRRDHMLGTAAFIVDASGYAVTLPSAYARVLLDSAAGLLLRAGLLARLAGERRVGAETAREAVRLADTAFLSGPTIGAVL